MIDARTDAPLLVECPRCGSDIHVDGVEWPDPDDYQRGDIVRVWVDCYAEACGGGDPMGEFDDGEPCGEPVCVGRPVLDDGTLGKCDVI